MNGMLGCGVVMAAAVALSSTPLRAQDTGVGSPLPESHLATRADGRWVTWWTAADAPGVWPAPLPAVANGIAWHRGAPGIEWGETVLAGSGEAWRTRIVVVRIDPDSVRFRVDTGFARPPRPTWSLDRVPPEAVFAVNAGQFIDALPWGWVVVAGHQVFPPGRGPLAVALAGDSAGGIHWLPSEAAHRARPPRVAWAFQSYPELLRNDTVPWPLRASGRGIDVGHRDARLALGRLPDGRLLVALTRFDALGGALGEVPFGPTAPEMAALMGALGCRDAVLLDGGISARMMVRDSLDAAHEWRGLRRVPLALVAFPSEPRDAARRGREVLRK